MLKNSLCLALVFLFVSCSEKSAPTLIVAWKKKNAAKTVERKLANTLQGQCFKNNFTVDSLRDQVKELEKDYGDPPKVKGVWKHLDLSKLPVPQANFLKTYGDMIGDQKDKDSIDYSSCEDVPCLFNKIYGKEDGVAGYVHYIWYLKFRHMLSADNVMPEDMDGYGRKKKEKVAGVHNGKSFPLSSYLYSEDELYGLWRLSMMLKKPQTDLLYLEEVQRAPRGDYLEGYDQGVCGLAYSGGWIKLSDECLTIGRDRDTGYLYQAVTHELNHQLDFQLGRGSKNFYRSHQDDYLQAAGMTLKEYVDANGVNIRQWDLLPGAKLITDYAGTNPQENFAETLAGFRVYPDKAKKTISSDHYEFVSKQYYVNENYEKETLIKKWISQSSSEINKSVMKAVIDCSQMRNVLKSPFFSLSDFSSPVIPSMLNCIGKKSEEIRDLIASKISMGEPEGCMVLNDKNTNLWSLGMKEILKLSFDKYLSELQSDKDYVSKIQSYYGELNDDTIAMESFVNCYQENNEAACWKNAVLGRASQKGQELNLSDDILNEYVDSYFAQHKYEDIKDSTLHSYRYYISSNLEDIRIGALRTWDSCLAIKQDDDSVPSGNFFTVSGYLVSSLYNCLNVQMPESIKEIIKGYSARDFDLRNGKEELLLSDHIKPEFTKILNGLYEAERVKEIAIAQEFIVNNGSNLRSRVLSNLNWLSDITDEGQITFDCKHEVMKELSFLPLYHTKPELFSDYVESNICYKINETTELHKWLENSKTTYSEQVYSSLYEITYNFAKDEANLCLQQYPMNTLLDKVRFKKHREKCLDDAWPRIEKNVVEKVMNDPLSKRLSVTEVDIQQKMSLNSAQIRTQIKQEFFKIDFDFGYDIPFQESFQSFL